MDSVQRCKCKMPDVFKLETQTVDKCQCGCNLRRGCIIIGWFGAIVSVLYAVVDGFLAATIHFMWIVYGLDLLGLIPATFLVAGAATRRHFLLGLWLISWTLVFASRLACSIWLACSPWLAVNSGIIYRLTLTIVEVLLLVYFVIVVRLYAIKLADSGKEARVEEPQPESESGSELEPEPESEPDRDTAGPLWSK